MLPEFDESLDEIIERDIPMGRSVTPTDVGRAVVFIAENRNVTGQSLVVDGGMLQMA